MSFFDPAAKNSNTQNPAPKTQSYYARAPRRVQSSDFNISARRAWILVARKMGRRLLYFPATPPVTTEQAILTGYPPLRPFRAERGASSPGPPADSNFPSQRRNHMSAETEHTTAAPAPEGKYVYCIIESKEPRSFGPIGIGGRGDEVYTVHHDGLAAVVSRTAIQAYEPTRAD